MEGKAALFKRFAGIDAWPICLDTQDPDEIVAIVQRIAPVFAGINLEDISAPRCFEIEARLRELLDIPVFHDDQHGTAIVVLAALTNALRVVGKELADVRIVMSGAGAAGTAILRLLLEAGRPATSSSPTSRASSTRGRAELHESLRVDRRRTPTPTASTGHAQGGRRAAPTSSSASRRPTSSTATTSPRWPTDAIVFALANPDPEVDPAEARAARGRGRDRPLRLPQPDQQRARLPGRLPRAARRLGHRDRRLAAASPRPTRSPRVVSADELNANYVIPSVFHDDVHTAVAAAVRAAAEALDDAIDADGSEG